MPRHAIEIKWAFWVILAWLATLAVALWSLTTLFANQQNIELGKAVDCLNRPNWQTLHRCDSRYEGIACAEESQTSLMAFVGSIDNACAQYEPDRVFRFPVNNAPETLEVAEVG